MFTNCLPLLECRLNAHVPIIGAERHRDPLASLHRDGVKSFSSSRSDWNRKWDHVVLQSFTRNVEDDGMIPQGLLHETEIVCCM